MEGVDPANPLIVQSDLTVLFEVDAPKAADARPHLARFADLEKAPEHIHTYRISPLSLWNAAVSGMSADSVVGVLEVFAKYDVPDSVVREVRDLMGRYGRLRLVRDHDTVGLSLIADSPSLIEEVAGHRETAELLGERLDGNRFAVRLGDRGAIKQTLLNLGWPVADEAGYQAGAGLGPVELDADLRLYQSEALSSWWQNGDVFGGSGVVCLPCGAGKTVVGLAAAVTAAERTLVVCTSISSARQWIREALEKTTLTESDVGEWSGERKQLRDVTVATYQALTWADPAADAGADLFVRHPNLSLFDQEEWGLIIYDEVHLLPAPVFRAAARIQTIRRLGLTATLIREDGREGDVFSLIGPMRYDVPWSELEALGWIAPAVCIEVRVPMEDERRMAYATAEPRARHRIAATSPEKLEVLERILAKHSEDQVLIIGQYVEQLEQVAERLGVPVMTGRTGQRRRDELFSRFRQGEERVLVVSKIANFSIDLPEAAVAVQLSGQFGSRQEEAQRLGRLLRPKADGGQAWFYSLVAEDTEETRFARNRQRFLAEQGYEYQIIDAPNFD